MKTKYSIFYPFLEVHETNIYPYSRILRTSFKQKLWDFYHIIAGWDPVSSHASEPYLGLFDYLTFGIPALFLAAGVVSFSLAQNYWPCYFLFIPMVLINLPFLMARVLTGAISTILYSPFIAIAHSFFSSAAQQSLDEAYTLVGESQGKEKTFKQYLDENNMNIEDVSCYIHRFSEIYGMPDTPNSYHLHVCSDDLDKRSSFNFNIVKDNTNSLRQSANIHSFFSLNVGRIISRIEDRKTQDPEMYSTLLQM